MPKSKPRLLISFSGGATSAYMAKWLLEHDRHNWSKILIVFANTGKEKEETLEFVQKCEEWFKYPVTWIEAITNPEWGKGVSAKEVDFNSASRFGEPFEAMIKKHGIPNVANPQCSRELKAYAIIAYCRQIKFRKYYTAIGFRADEAKRIPANATKRRLVFPLIHKLPTIKADINKFWGEMPFRLQLKGYEGNCNKCWKKSLPKLLTIELEEREKGELDTWWADMEEKYGDYIASSRRQNTKIKPPFYFYRGHTSAKTLAELSLKEFKKAEDDSTIIDGWRTQSLMQVDEGNDCSESCEAI